MRRSASSGTPVAGRAGAPPWPGRSNRSTRQCLASSGVCRSHMCQVVPSDGARIRTGASSGPSRRYWRVVVCTSVTASRSHVPPGRTRVGRIPAQAVPRCGSLAKILGAGLHIPGRGGGPGGGRGAAGGDRPEALGGRRRDGGAGGGQEAARVDQFRRLVQRGAERPEKATFSSVPMLIFVMPCSTAARSVVCGTPEEPCRTSGTGTASRSREISSRSSAAVRVTIAWLLPTATARASTPVSATNRAASEGRCARPGCARSPCRRSRRVPPR